MRLDLCVTHLTLGLKASPPTRVRVLLLALWWAGRFSLRVSLIQDTKHELVLVLQPLHFSP